MWLLIALGLLFPTDASDREVPASRVPPDLTVSVLHGEASVRRRCAACHAVGVDGASPLPSAPPFREVAGRYPVENLEEALAEGIYVGHGPMPPFALEADEVADIIAYLRTLRTRAADAEPRR